MARRGWPAARALARLVRVAREARRRAYAPYSGFKVGAAVLAAGRVFPGANVENASYPVTICAERAALAAAAVSGARRIEAVAVASGSAEPVPPCGMCLQALAELGAPSLPVLLVGAGGRCVETTLAALLPRSFGKRFL